MDAPRCVTESVHNTYNPVVLCGRARSTKGAMIYGDRPTHDGRSPALTNIRTLTFKPRLLVRLLRYHPLLDSLFRCNRNTNY